MTSRRNSSSSSSEPSPESFYLSPNGTPYTTKQFVEIQKALEKQERQKKYNKMYYETKTKTKRELEQAEVLQTRDENLRLKNELVLIHNELSRLRHENDELRQRLCESLYTTCRLPPLSKNYI